MAKLIVPAGIVLAIAALAVTSAQAATPTIKLHPGVGHPSAISDGVVYAGSTDGTLRAFKP
jgi:hypothetical protein